MEKYNHLAYKFDGEGPLQTVLVHNAGGNHQFMEPTFSYFSQKGKTLTIDLTGHGESDAPEREYTPGNYAQDLLALCEHLGLENTLFIGLNYGGNVGLELHRRNPRIIEKLVMIEPPILMEPWIVKHVEDHLEDLKTQDMGEYAKAVVDAICVQPQPADREVAIRAFEKTPQRVQYSTFESLLKWDKEFFSEKIDLPTLYIQTTVPYSLEEKVAPHFSNLTTGRVVGSGSWATLEVPDQIHAMVDRFLSLSN